MAENVARLLERSARRWPDKPVLVSADPATDSTTHATTHSAIDWARCEARAGGLAARLAASGIGIGDRLALDIEDPSELVIALFGALKTGATVTPLNPRLTPDERAKILADLAPTLVVDAVGDEEAAFPARDVAPDDCAIILYTSGSTGLPKGVRLSHRATEFALISWRDPVMDLSPGDISLSALPLAHSLGIFGSVMAPLLAGGSVAFLPRFTPEGALAAIARHRVTVFPGVATMFRRILDTPEIATTDLGSLRYALSGAAPCPWELADAWRKATGVRIVRGYGMTELFRPISYSAADPDDRPDSIGRAVPEVDLLVVDEDEIPLAAGETGELWIKSPACMSEYLGKPAETDAVLDDGWFKTGDLAAVSEDGFVRIVGRKKDMIIRGGYTVAAGEVEAMLLTHPAISEAAVIGVADADLGEEVAAFVTVKPNADPSAEEIIAFCRERMAGYKYPRHVRFQPDMPKGPAGKVIKAGLRL